MNSTTNTNTTDTDQEFSAGHTSIAMISKEEGCSSGISSSSSSSSGGISSIGISIGSSPDPLGVSGVNHNQTPNTNTNTTPNTDASALNPQYSRSSVAELTEVRLRALSEMLRTCISNTNDSGMGLGGISSLVPGKKNNKGEITPQFIADKMELLSDVLGGLYSIPEYDETFLTLVSSDEASSNISNGIGNRSNIVLKTPTKITPVTPVKSTPVNDPLSML